MPVQNGQDGNSNYGDIEEEEKNQDQVQMVQIDFHSLQNIDKIHYVLGMFKYVGCNSFYYTFKFGLWTIKKFFITFRESMIMIYNSF